MDRAISLEARRIDLSIEPPFILGRVRVDPPAHEITAGRKAERIQPQALKVLVALHDKSGQVVTRDEIVDRCWEGRIVGDDVINRCILLLRRVAKETGGFEIETVPRAGYRLVERPVPRKANLRNSVIAGCAVTLIAIGSVAFFSLFKQQQATTPTLSIALLPFVATSEDSDTRRIASASREAVANTLAQGAYAVSTIDALSQGSRPAADFAISAQVTGSADKIVATVRMEETAHHVVVFTHQFETTRDKADDLPDIVAGQVASQVSWTAPLLALERRHPSNPTIIASLLQSSPAGLEGSGILHDYEITRRLARENPDSPLAQTSFAFNASFALDQIPRQQRAGAVEAARTAADRAIALAPEFGDNYVPWCLLRSEQRLAECENHIRLGTRADPDAPFAGWFLASIVLNPVGREDEALELARANLAHDQYMPAKIGLMLRLLEATGHRAEADQLYTRSSRWWPNDGGLKSWRMAGMAQAGDFETLAGSSVRLRGTRNLMQS